MKKGGNNSFCSSIDTLSNDDHIHEHAQEINAEQEEPNLLDSSSETKRLLRNVTKHISELKDDLAEVIAEASKFMDFKVAERNTAKKTKKRESGETVYSKEQQQRTR